MTATANLNVTHIAASETQKEVRANAAFDRFDAAITESLDVSVASGNATPTAEQVRQVTRLIATGAATSGRTITLPAVQRCLIIGAAAGNSHPVDFVRGSTSIEVNPGDSFLAYVDGTTDGLEIVQAPAQAATLRIGIAVSDETTDLTTGTAKVTFRMPCAMTLTAVRSSLADASSSGLVTVDINEGGSTILSTKLSIDQGEKTSTTAATAAVISDSALADDAEITIDIDAAGTDAKGLKVWLIGLEV